MGERPVHTRVVVYVAGLLVVVAVVGAVTWRVLGAHSTYQQALDTLPAPTLRVAYTDWGVARDQAGGNSLSGGSSQRRVAAFLSRASTRDLISGSGVAGSTEVLSRRYGFSALDADWEAVGTSRGAAQVDVLKLDGVDMGALEPRLSRLGYTLVSGVWTGSSALVTRLNGTLAPLLKHFVVLPDEHLVLLSASAAYASQAAAAAKGSGSSVLDRSGVGSLAGGGGGPAPPRPAGGGPRPRAPPPLAP